MCQGLNNCLTGNGVAMMPYQAYKDMIMCLPEELESARLILMGNLADKDWPEVPPTIKASAYMMDYCDKSRTEEAAAHLTLTKGPGEAGNKFRAGRQQRHKSLAKERKVPYRKRCRQIAHLQPDCPKAKEEEAFKARMEHVAARIDHLELQLGEGLPPMANAVRGHFSSRS
eukprot:jgi/Botrbrau1/17992/Bobra.0664s0001.1